MYFRAFLLCIIPFLYGGLSLGHSAEGKKDPCCSLDTLLKSGADYNALTRTLSHIHQRSKRRSSDRLAARQDLLPIGKRRHRSAASAVQDEIAGHLQENHLHSNRLRREAIGANETVTNDTQLSYRFRGVFPLVDESHPSQRQSGHGGSGSVSGANSGDVSSASENNGETHAAPSKVKPTISFTKESNLSEIEVTTSSLSSNDTTEWKEGESDTPDSEAKWSEPLSEPESEPEPEPGVEPKDESKPTENLDTSESVPQYELDISYYTDNEPEPESKETLSEPEMEEEGSGLPEPEPETEPEPEYEPTSEPEDDGCHRECYAEPSPDWDEAKEAWMGAWEVHVYGFGIMFAVLALYSLASVIRLSQHRNLLSQGYFLSLNMMLFVLCVSRAVFLLVDGYNSKETFHPIVSYLLYSLGFPSLTSAFSILFLALLRTMKMELMSPRIQSPKTLTAVIIFHFMLSVSTDMIIGYYFDSRITSLVCQVASLVWGFVLMSAYLYTFRCLYRSVSHSEIIRYEIGDSDHYSPGSRKKPRVVMTLALKVTLITAVFGFVNMSIHIYGMIDVISVFKDEEPQPWPWWILHFTLRLTELGMAVLMMFVASQPFRYPHNVLNKDPTRNQLWDLMYFAPCFRVCHFGSEKDDGSQLQMTAHQESLLRSHQSSSLSQVNNIYTPNLDTQPRVIDNKLFSAVSESGTMRSSASRPTSMLIQEDGLIRFRLEDDPVGEPIISTDEELEANINTNCRSVDDYMVQDKMRNYQRSNSAPQGDTGSQSVPTTGLNTPKTPRSFLSIDPEEGMFLFRPPSSIHLRASIEGALDCSDLSLRSPGYSESGFPLHNMPEDFEDWAIEATKLRSTSHVCDIPENSNVSNMHGSPNTDTTCSPGSANTLGSFTVAEVRDFLMRSSLHQSENDSLSHIKCESNEYGTHV